MWETDVDQEEVSLAGSLSPFAPGSPFRLPRAESLPSTSPGLGLFLKPRPTGPRAPVPHPPPKPRPDRRRLICWRFGNQQLVASTEEIHTGNIREEMLIFLN